jgi:hypothetical protein
MTFKTTTCVALSCNTCGEFLNPWDDDGERHFDSADDAIQAARDEGWIVWPDGFAVCPENDDVHRAAVAELMPPEFVPVCDGQAKIPFAENGAGS